MKKILFGVALSLICCAVFSQIEQQDSKLLSKYSSEYLQELASSNPKHLAIIKFECNNSYEIQEMPSDKVESLEKLCYITDQKQKGEIITDFNIETFNLFDCYYERKLLSSAYYRIGETNLVLILMSEKEFATEFNKTQTYE